MSSFSIIRPSDDPTTIQSSNWGKRLTSILSSSHTLLNDVDSTTPANRTNVEAAYKSSADLLCYFGHGEDNRWETKGVHTLESTSLPKTCPAAVVSIACKTGCTLGPAAITSGVSAWLGFTVKVGVIAPYASAHGSIDTIGDAIVNGLKVLDTGASMQDVRNEVEAELDKLVVAYDTGGTYSHHPDAAIGYFVAGYMRDHVVLHGKTGHSPLI